MTDYDKLKSEAQAAQELASKATPEPWTSDLRHFGVFDASGESVATNSERNFPFVAASHTHVDLIQRQQAAIDELRAKLAAGFVVTDVMVERASYAYQQGMKATHEQCLRAALEAALSSQGEA